ncbi:tandem-95 repeat protein, partial [Pseudomonas sp. NPDC088429]|uniref:tandem-95 repeat protein n=1 Tax=Pseudomonas sp. NPDC088429 TaxID=3364455 RepID=UPI0037F7C775
NTSEDVAFSGQVVATDADSDTLAYSVVTQPTNGTLTLDAATGAYTYTPTADYNGTDSFVVEISDGNGGVVQSVVTLTVTPVADIAADTVTTNEDTPIIIAVNNNDTFENGGHAITAINATAVTVGVPLAVSNGSVTLNADGTLSFTPVANFNGATSFAYTVSSDGITETATVTINVTAVNYVPVPTDPGIPGQTFDPATGNYAVSTPEDVAFSGQVVATDADSNTLAYLVATQPTTGTLTLDAATGAYTYTPTADYNGTDSFVVEISDGNGGIVQSVVTLTVTPVADIAADTVTTTEDTPIIIAVNNNDTFENGGHAITAINATAVTVGVPLAVSNGSVTLNTDDTLSFTPVANFNGATSFNYTVSSGGVTETATVTVNITAVNDAPVPTDPGVPGQTFDPATGNYAVSTPEDVAFSGQVVATDADSDTLAYSVATQPTNGTLTLNAATGAYTYTPTADYNGTDSFVVEISDGNGGIVQSVVMLTVTPVTDISADAVNTYEGASVTIVIGTNDTFKNPNYLVTAINGRAATVGLPILVSNGLVTLNADGTLAFEPASNFTGTTNFNYTVSSGGVVETTVVTVNVIPETNEPPVARDDYPFVYRPQSEVKQEAAVESRRFVVEPPVITTVNDIGWLNGTSNLQATGAVEQAVKGVESLNGTEMLGASGVILQAVNDVEFLHGTTTPEQHENSLRQTIDAADGHGLNGEPEFVASLRTADGVLLDLIGTRERLHLSMTSGVKQPLEMRASLANGKALPAWVHTDTAGSLEIEPPVDVERIRLRLDFDRRDGATQTFVEIDLTTGQMQEIPDPNFSETKDHKTSLRPAAPDVSDFATQLEKASQQRRSQDADLMALLNG